MLLVEHGEQLGIACRTFRRPEEKVRAGLQCIVEGLDHAMLKLTVEIDHHVAAGNQIEPGERRVSHDAVHREDAHLADGLDRAVHLSLVHKPALQAIRGYGAAYLAIARGAGDGYGASVEIGAEDVHLQVDIGSRHRFFDEDCQ